ncbi:hypothetical protein PHYPSEUDO_012525 [Phytophthora pseudosyringae]|uniref:Uncharacterized protein n=1 Tax=Phytophthora pseudosyringae TaxID=221518 RepID=A0A8T1W8D1_9STRA|nr:hypothetical protein PHYPSEUDO_012525 [Phytophthora pseudosyringae]
MGNIASATLFARLENSHWDFTASDMLLDQMEKQACPVTTSTWLETLASYCALVLSSLAALLMGNFTGSLDQPKQIPTLVDAACQTEDECFTMLSVRGTWQSCHVVSKEVADDDSHSCTTETTELFTDAESEDYERDFSDDDSEWEDGDSAAEDVLQAICDACESCADCDCETQAEQLLRLTAIVCDEKDDSRPIFLEDYLCTCGECPQYKEITRDVAVAVKPSLRQSQSTVRLLQAFSTYNEVLGYRADMIPTAHECLRIWCGDEDKAFKSFVTLYDEVPRLCDPARSIY